MLYKFWSYVNSADFVFYFSDLKFMKKPTNIAE